MSPEDGWNPESVREFEDFDRVPQYDGPQESAAVPGDWPFALEDEISNLTGKASVASHIRELIRTLIGADPFEPLIMLVSGDWHMLLLQAMAFEDTGIAFEKIADNVNRGRFAIQDRWDGNAAAAAENWLAQYWQACVYHAEFIREASWKIKNFAKAAYHAFVALNTLVDMLLDSLFDLLARTNGVGAIVAGAISIIQGENPLEAIASVTSAVTNIGTVIDGLRILVNGVQGAFELLAGNGEIVAKAWPVEPYAHPEVS